MSEEAKRPYNPPAFPSPETEKTYFEPGMSLRDWFAGQALAGLISGQPLTDDGDLAHEAYRIADAMLVAREKVS